MFWENGKRYSQMVDSPFHVSMASLECTNDGNQPVAVMVEHQNAEYMLCTLKPDVTPQQQLDLNFEEGEEITLFINGHGTVHLTGYLLEANEANEMSDLDLEEMESEDEEEENTSIKKKRKQEMLDQKPAKKLKQAMIVEAVEDSSDLDSSDENEDLEELLVEKKSPKNGKGANIFVQKGDKFVNTPIRTPNKMNNSLANKSSSKKNKPKTTSDSDDEDDDTDDDIVPIPSDLQKLQKKGVKQFANTSQMGNKMGNTPKGNKATPNKLGNKTLNDTANETPVSMGGTESEKKKKKKKKKKPKNLNASEVSNDSVLQTPNTKKEFPNTPKSSQKLPGGTLVEDITMGSGPVAKKGKVVQLNYVGRLKNNQIFDQSKKFPFRFRLGANEVIPGMDQGVEGMKVGGKRKIIVPPHKGYGNKVTGPIPANSTLIFEVELKSVS